MRCTLEWLRPTAMAVLRSDQCVPPGGFSLSVMLTTRLIVAESKGGFGRVPFEPSNAAHQIAIPPSISGSFVFPVARMISPTPGCG